MLSCSRDFFLFGFCTALCAAGIKLLSADSAGRFRSSFRAFNRNPDMIMIRIIIFCFSRQHIIRSVRIICQLIFQLVICIIRHRDFPCLFCTAVITDTFFFTGGIRCGRCHQRPISEIMLSRSRNRPVFCCTAAAAGDGC